jgi:hypothetical protein
MQESALYEYAVIRVVPRVEREEFLNVGVIVYCAKQGFLRVRYHLDSNRLRALFSDLDLPDLADYLHTWERISMGGPSAGPIGLLPPAGRFRWLTATRSTVVQTSKVHPGLCTGLAQATLDGLFEQLVS